MTQQLRFRRGHPRILMYHAIQEVLADPMHVCVRPGRFRQQMRYLRRRGLRGVSVRELLAAGARGRDRGLVGLTFDDGFENFITRALPVLQDLGFTSTLYPVVGRLGGTNAWDAGGPVLRIVDAGQLRTLAGSGTEIGSHGLSHIRLSQSTEDVIDHEVATSRSELAEIVGDDVDGFCYPYGDHDERVVAAVERAGYDYACAYHTHGVWDRFTLPRAHVGASEGPVRLEAKLQVTDPLERLRRWRRAAPGASEFGARS